MNKLTISSKYRVLRWHTLLTLLLLVAIFVGAGGGIFTAQAAGNSAANFVQDENFSGEAGLSDLTLQQYLDSQAGPFKTYQENSLGGSQKAAQVLLIASQQDGFSVNPLIILSLYQIRYNVLTSTSLTPQNVASFWPEYVKSPSQLNDQVAALSYRLQSYYDDNTAKPGQLALKLRDGTTVQAPSGLNRTSLAILRVLGETATQSEWNSLLSVTGSVFKTSYTAARAKVGVNAVPRSYPGRFLQHPRKDHNTGINAQLDHDQSGGILDYKGGSNTYDGHAGTDYNANYVDFYAAADGVVEASVDNYGGRPSWCPSWAAWNVPERYVIIRHSNGYRTKYWHLSARAVNQGDSVHMGDRIGTTGNSGCSSGPHAHFEVSDTSNTPTDPYGYCANPNRSDPWKVADYWLWSDATSPCAQQNPGDGGGQSCTTLVDDSCSNFTAAGNPAGWHIQSGYGSINGSFHWTQNSPDPSGTDHDNATWRPTLPQRGYYDVWVNITSNYATTTNAQYWVHYSGGGAVKIVVNQNASTGWVKLGNWLFETDGSSYVYLDDVTGEPYLSTYLDADAVEWRYTGPAVTLSSIAVSPANATIDKGATRQYTATGAYSDGHTQDLTGSVSWTSSNSSVASISGSGLATALNSGSTQITATKDGISGTTSLNVGTGTAPTYNTRLSTARGFDTCSAPGLAQLQSWWNSSPYRDVNIYIGGSSRACNQPNLNASWVSQASAMGWGLIPTWVGPQAPCTGFSNKLSSDPTTAGQQGIAEANAASDAAAALGLTKTIIFYDMEQYSTGGSCSTAVQAFVNGWSQQLYARGNLPGVYGSPYAAEADWHNVIATPPYAVWIAQWICANQNDDACYATYTPSVYGIAPLNDANWSGHQRIHQYRGGHNESYGGVALNIDLDIEDTQVAVAAAAAPSPLIVTQTTDTGNVNQPGNLSTALASAGNGDKIQFNLPAGQSTITVKGVLPPLKKGAAIQGLCGPNGPTITLLGSDPAAPASGLTLSGNNTLYGLAIRQFRGKQLDLNGTTGNHLQCVRLSKS